jgi:hypothetical protein
MMTEEYDISLESSVSLSASIELFLPFLSLSLPSRSCSSSRRSSSDSSKKCDSDSCWSSRGAVRSEREEE